MASRTRSKLWKPVAWAILVVVLIAAFLQWRSAWLEERRARADRDHALVNAQRSARRRGQPPPPPNARIHDSPRYRIITTANAAQTEQVAQAIESLHDAYLAFFSDQLPTHSKAGITSKLQLTLYRNREQFQSYNYSLPWAEAYYLKPMCHAYYVEGEANPYHWMVHEATHQLNAEIAGFKKVRWIDEGLGTYFGSSRIEQGRLRLGDIDRNAYPIWWLSSISISGDLYPDIERQRWIPIRALITGQDAPPIGQYVNLYYVQYWSLTHFLFHYDNGRYADAYKRVIVEGGTLANFEKHIGPVDRIQREWYGYLLDLRRTMSEAAPTRSTADVQDDETLIVLPER